MVLKLAAGESYIIVPSKIVDVEGRTVNSGCLSMSWQNRTGGGSLESGAKEI